MQTTDGAYVIPAGRVVRGRLRPPSSKSLTQRALNLGLLQGHPVTIDRALASEDTRHFLQALVAIGCEVRVESERIALGGRSPVGGAEIWCGDNGTMLRFLTASLATIPGEWSLTGSERLRQRTVEPLAEALRSLGARIEFPQRQGFAPVRILGTRLLGGGVELDASQSSQFASALVMAATQAREPVAVRLLSPVSAPYLELTLGVLKDFAGEVELDADGLGFRVQPSRLSASCFTVEADFSAAAYPAAAAAITGGEVVLTGLAEDSGQGDRQFLDVLAEMGAQVLWEDSGVLVRGTGKLRGVEVDFSDLPDQVPTLAAIAPFAHGSTEIRNVAHLRIKESDRLAAMARELQRLGARVEERPDGLRIEGDWSAGAIPDSAVEVDTHGDHRVAMSLAVCGLCRPGVSVRAPEVVAKSYPEFWSDLESLLQE